MSYYSGDEWRWGLSAPSHHPSIVVCDLAEDAEKHREEKIKAGAHVVPFGFSRVLPQPPKQPTEPLLWNGED